MDLVSKGRNNQDADYEMEGKKRRESFGFGGSSFSVDGGGLQWMGRSRRRRSTFVRSVPVLAWAGADCRGTGQSKCGGGSRLRWGSMESMGSTGYLRNLKVSQGIKWMGVGREERVQGYGRWVGEETSHQSPRRTKKIHRGRRSVIRKIKVDITEATPGTRF